MRFSCEKVLLQNAVNTASRAVSSKSSIPALEGLLLQAEEKLTISGYNMQTGIRTNLSAGCSAISSAGCRTISSYLLPTKMEACI